MATEPGNIEGAAGVAIAALEAAKSDIAGSTVVVIICGGNIAAETLDTIA
jgi:threonine dehydratase